MSDASSPRPWWCELSRDHWFVFNVASLAWLFDCLDAQLFNLARGGAMLDLVGRERAAEFGSYTMSFFLVGWAVGGFIFGALGDRFGRARILTFSVLIYSLCTGLSCLSTGFLDFGLYRFATGVGIGGVFGLSVALIADSLPDRTRAPALGLFQSLSTWGNIVAGLLGMGVGALAARGLLPLGLKAWQSLFLIGALPALLCVLILNGLKEPVKWVNAHAAGAQRGVRFGSYTELLGGGVWARNAWLGVVMCCAGVVGLWGLGNFHPQIISSIVDQHLATANLPPAALSSARTNWSSFGLLLQNVGGFFGMMTLSWLAQTQGRRIAYAVAISLSFLTTVLVFKFLREFSQIFWMLPLMGFGQLSVFAVYAIYLPELFPTRLRSTGTSFCYNAGRIIAASAPVTVGQITKRLGGDIESFRTAGLYVSLVLLVGLVAIPFLPEMKGRPLPEE
ncbi:MAG TPA: MFS transporter [Candidatus Didemnitutus sp.]|nr:MFS transporter [Candidatus Didemnitutus sp.]